MDDKLPISAHREDSFDSAVRGFNRQQVLEYMSRSSQLLASLEQNLAVARADVQRARAEADRARAEAAGLRSAQAEAKPVREEVSERLSQILRLAAEEADQDRATATEEITKLRMESQAESERLINEARQIAERELAEARATADHELTEARETAEHELAEARSRAEEGLRAAREEAARIRSTSEEQSAELLDDAARRAGAVNEVSDQRLDTLTATHGEAVLRLGQIRDVLADLLDRDAAAGSLADVVEAVIAPTRGSRPEIDTRPEIEDGIDQDQTSIVPAVDVTAVHEPVRVSVEDGRRDEVPSVAQGRIQEEDQANVRVVDVRADGQADGPVEDQAADEDQATDEDQPEDQAEVPGQDRSEAGASASDTADAPADLPADGEVRESPVSTLSETVEHQIDLREAAGDSAERGMTSRR